MTNTQVTHPLLGQPPQTPVQSMPTVTEPPAFVFDARMDWGKAMVLLGIVAVLGAIALAFQENSEGSLFDEADYTATGGLFGLGGFFVLIGVILIAGAHPVAIKPPKAKR